MVKEVLKQVVYLYGDLDLTIIEVRKLPNFPRDRKIMTNKFPLMMSTQQRGSL
ncbi:hypothetical protein ES319_D13G146600v1 [Gossypium barbadense]|uniref:Uncharacterized protein n=3 Tax=Gossypium TaxID=3633 RepID=A0A5J5NMI8_GOSBA|nr:hypothetical protein ES319_D13G146600v1 [Gossypium barbadense]TYG37632.1 hypothetical protein ES288_D13G156800v1 [Gossypium darwinii]TYH34896.1 hypothetical protein ES332_D13G156700v1 [Gossypium tomentosum]